MTLRIWRTLSFFIRGASCLGGGRRSRRRPAWRLARRARLLRSHVVDRLVALVGDLLGGSCSILSAATVARTTLCGFARAEALGEDVVDARRLDDGANRAAGDDARSRRGRAEEAPCRRRSGRTTRAGSVDAVERHLEHVLARLIVALADGLGHLVGLAEADADVTRLVADDDERREAEAPAALDDLGHAVDVDDALLELFFVDLIERHVELFSVRGLRPASDV